MRKKIFLIAVIIGVCGFLLTGCTIGDEMVSLTESEEDAVVAYAAHVITKYNKYCVDGLVNPSPKPKEEETVAEEEFESEEQEVPAESQTPSESQASSESQQPSESSGTSSQSSGNSGSKRVSMTSAMGFDGVSFKYQGYDVTKEISEGSYFSIDAADGMKYIKLNFKMKASKATAVNVMAKDARFRLTINGGDTYLSQATLLLNDLSTFEDKLTKGETRNVILVFEADNSVVKSVDSLTLEVTMGNKTREVSL